MNETVKNTTLDKGLRIISKKISDNGTASICISVKVGSRYEEEANSGISHFIEHILFKGTNNRDNIQIAKEMDNMGGYFNAYTGKEYTVYHTTIMSEHIEPAIELMADMLQNSIFDPQEMEREKDVVLQEIAQNNDEPEDILYDKVLERIFSNKPLGRTVLGDRDFIRKVEALDIKKYMSKYYTMDNIVIAVAGDVDHEKITRIVEKYITKFPSTRHKLVLDSGEYGKGNIKIERELEQLHVLLNFAGIPYLDENHYAYRVLVAILGAGMSSRLFQEIREKRGLAYSVGCSSVSYSDAGILQIFAGIAPERFTEFMSATRNEIDKTTQSKATEEELERVKNQIRFSIKLSNESSLGVAEYLSYCLHKYGKYVKPSEHIDKINAVTTEDVLNLARKIFSHELTTGIIGNISRTEI